MNLRVGLIGYGSWTRMAYVPALRQDGRARIVSAAAPSAATQQRIRPMLTRLLNAPQVGPPRPDSFLTLDDDALRSIGFSRQKSRYSRTLATAVVEERLDLDQLIVSDDETVRASVIELPGIGPWSAEIYLLFALNRQDAWPASDLGVFVGAQKVKRLPARPSKQETDIMAEAWRPWRGLATFIL